MSQRGRRIVTSARLDSWLETLPLNSDDRSILQSSWWAVQIVSIPGWIWLDCCGLHHARRQRLVGHPGTVDVVFKWLLQTEAIILCTKNYYYWSRFVGDIWTHHKFPLFRHSVYGILKAQFLYTSAWSIHRRRNSVNFRGHDIFARKMCMKNCQNARILHDSCPKNYQNTLIFMTFARNINKISEFYTIFARKMPEFHIIIARKIFFPNFGGHNFGGHVPFTAPSHTPMDWLNFLSECIRSSPLRTRCIWKVCS